MSDNRLALLLSPRVRYEVAVALDNSAIEYDFRRQAVLLLFVTGEQLSKSFNLRPTLAVKIDSLLNSIEPFTQGWNFDDSLVKQDLQSL